jgi:hypothetical protein
MQIIRYRAFPARYLVLSCGAKRGVSRFGSKVKVCAVGLACRSNDLSTAARR